jgi:hypothetical protein
MKHMLKVTLLQENANQNHTPHKCVRLSKKEKRKKKENQSVDYRMKKTWNPWILLVGM